MLVILSVLEPCFLTRCFESERKVLEALSVVTAWRKARDAEHGLLAASRKSRGLAAAAAIGTEKLQRRDFKCIFSRIRSF